MRGSTELHEVQCDARKKNGGHGRDVVEEVIGGLVSLLCTMGII